MTEHARDLPELPDVSRLVTEDDEPVDNLQSEKAQRLLVGALYTSWQGPPLLDDEETEGGRARRRFLAAANVGIFATPHEAAIAPDVLVSTDVSIDELSWHDDERRSYFVWEMGKPPEVVVEIVSNREGDELGRKLRRYGRMHVSHYVVFDPRGVLGGESLRAFELRGDVLRPSDVEGERIVFEELDLGLCLWEGRFEGAQSRWLRFTDGAARLLPTGEERAERLAAKLRALGVDPDE